MGIIKVPAAATSKFLEIVPSIFQSGNFAEGKWNKSLAHYFKEYAEAQNAEIFASNGSALLAILQLLKRYRGYNDIFIQSNTMYGVKTIAVTSGLKFIGSVDCSISHLMPTVEQVQTFISKLSNPAKTVFLITHIGGIVNPDINEIATLCEKAGIALVEDCAHSLGATLHGKHTGTFGIAGAYSLYATKAIPAGEGGVAVTNDQDLGSMLSRFNIYDRFDQQQEIGVNFRMSEMQALFSLCVVELADEIIANKTEIAKRYVHACEVAGFQYIDPFNDGQKGNHYKFTLIAENSISLEFNKIKNRTSGVYDYSLGSDPQNISERHLCLPIWYELDETIVEETVSQIMS